MNTACDVITFDCYGTLIDWETGIRQAFRSAALANGARIENSHVIETYARAERAVEEEAYRPYRQVLGESASRTARALGWPLEPQRAGFLAESVERWKPFPDTNPALQRLREAGVRLGILSNVDDDLLEATRRHFAASFDVIVTAAQVQSYKPNPAHFVAARELIGNRRWLHAAQSNFHDIVPANALGIPTAWVNRHRQSPLPGGDPTHEFRDLTELADFVISS